MIGGKLVAVPRGVFAAAGALQGARGGTKRIPKDQVDAVRGHVARYYAKLDTAAPWAESIAAVLPFVPPAPADSVEEQMGFSATSLSAAEPTAGDASAPRWEGAVWDTVLVRAGLSGNGAYFGEEELRAAAPSFEGTPVNLYRFEGEMLNHLPDQVKAVFPRGVIGNLAGWVKNARFGLAPDDGRPAILAQVHTSTPEAGRFLASIWRGARQLMPGLSIDIRALFTKQPVEVPGGRGRRILSIQKVDSTDIVSQAAAGGEFLRMVASLADELATDRIVDLVRQIDATSAPASGVPVERAAAESLLLSAIDGYEKNAATIEERNFARALMQVKDLMRTGSVGPALRLVDSLIAGAAFGPIRQDIHEYVARALALLRDGKTEEAMAVLEQAAAGGTTPPVTESRTPPAPGVPGSAREKEAIVPDAAPITTPQFTTPAALRAAFPALADQIVQEARKAWDDEMEDEKMRRKKDEEETAARKREVEALQASLATEKSAREAAEKRADTAEAGLGVIAKQAMVDRVIQSSALKDHVANKAVVSDRFVASLKVAKDEAEIKALIDDRVGIIAAAGRISESLTTPPDLGNGNPNPREVPAVTGFTEFEQRRKAFAEGKFIAEPPKAATA